MKSILRFVADVGNEYVGLNTALFQLKVRFISMQRAAIRLKTRTTLVPAEYEIYR
jgi:hypothetical protein